MQTTSPFWIALFFGLILIPIVRKISFRLGVVATPRKDRWHSTPTPKIGGVGIFVAFAIALFLCLSYIPVEQPPWALLLGATITFGLGLYDDFKRISPPAKLVGQIIATAIVVFFGRNLQFFEIEALNVLFTFAWLIGITNAINLLDNMDGLAGGIAFIAALMLSIMFWQISSYDLLLISLALAGAALGFLRYNFPPASIFMGDSGSQFLGFTLASLAIARVPRASDLLAILGVPTLLFLLPILDTTLVTVTRILRGQSPAQGGRDHTSHRLIAFGLTERQAVLILYGIALLSGLLGTLLESLDYTISLVLIPVLLVALTILTAYLGRLKVVDPATQTAPKGAITRLMVGLTVRGRIIEVAFDLILISIAYYLAFFVHFGSDASIINMDIFVNNLPLALAGVSISLFGFGIYRGVWQFVQLGDLARYAIAVLGGVLLVAFASLLLYPATELPLRVFGLFAIFLFLGLSISRSSFRLLDQIYNQQLRPPTENYPVLIFGADDLGVLALQWLAQTPELHFRVVGFLDDDPFKYGRQIHGVTVLGSEQQLEQILSRHKVEGIIFSSESQYRAFAAQPAKDLCSQKGIWLRRIRITFDAIE